MTGLSGGFLDVETVCITISPTPPYRNVQIDPLQHHVSNRLPIFVLHVLPRDAGYLFRCIYGVHIVPYILVNNSLRSQKLLEKNLPLLLRTVENREDGFFGLAQYAAWPLISEPIVSTMYIGKARTFSK
jgi:hypothetical protein